MIMLRHPLSHLLLVAGFSIENGSYRSARGCEQQRVLNHKSDVITPSMRLYIIIDQQLEVQHLFNLLSEAQLC